MAKTFKEYLEDFGSSELFGFDGHTGQLIPQTSNVLSAIKELMKDVFDQNLSIESETPAGRLCEAWAMTFARFCAVTATYANQINPYYATGQLLDAIGSLFSVTRTGATATVITCTFSGTAGTVIPSGSIIKNNAGDEFTVNTNVTIGDDGNATGFATCTEVGPKSVEIGSVTTIVSTVVGWNAVTNIGTFSAGDSIESDESYRQRILNTRWTGTAFVYAIRAEVERVSGVRSIFVVDNGYGTSKYLAYSDGVLTLLDSAPLTGKYVILAPHTVLVIASGAFSDMDVATAIFNTKPVGCGYSTLDATAQGSAKGTVVEKYVTDEISGVSYKVVFNKPLTYTFGVNITVGKNQYRGTDAELVASVQNAVKAWAKGETPFVDGLQLGQSIYSYEIGAAVSDVVPTIQIKNVEIVYDDGDSETDNAISSLELFINELGVLDETNINVTIS